MQTRIEVATSKATNTNSLSHLTRRQSKGSMSRHGGVLVGRGGWLLH